jgi:predicted  nucleic acid-binding Zn-ribbon protein
LLAFDWSTYIYWLFSVQTEIELQVVQKDIRIVELSKQVQDLESQLDTERASAARELSSAAEQVTTCKKSADELQRQISALPTLEEFNKLKTKLTALKAFEVEMGAEIPEGVELTSELILRDKNRKLETENIKMKVWPPDSYRTFGKKLGMPF